MWSMLGRDRFKRCASQNAILYVSHRDVTREAAALHSDQYYILCMVTLSLSHEMQLPIYINITYVYTLRYGLRYDIIRKSLKSEMGFQFVIYILPYALNID